MISYDYAQRIFTSIFRLKARDRITITRIFSDDESGFYGIGNNCDLLKTAECKPGTNCNINYIECESISVRSERGFIWNVPFFAIKPIK